MTWYRMYHDVLGDPKIQRLAIELRWRWVELLCIASKSKVRGELPDLDAIAYLLRVSKSRAVQIVETMIESRLVDRDQASQRLTIHDWDQHQRSSDGSADRVQRYRERARHVTGNVTGNGDVTLRKRSRVRPRAGADSETDTETEEDPPTPPAVSSLGPEYLPVAKYAEDQGGDVSWAIWSDRMGRAGHPARLIRAALDEAVGNGKLNQGYVATILRRWAVEGEPDRRNGTAPRRAEPVIRIHRKGDPL